MPEAASLEGWAPVVGRDGSLEEIIERAFDYRGDVTVERRDGSRLTGYLYNRDRRVPEPFIQMFDPTGASHTIRYADVAAIAFTGKDTAAGKSYEAWKERRAAQARSEAGAESSSPR
jgi:hypothetical protein